MPIDNNAVIEFFKNRNGHGRGPSLHSAAYYLVRMILAYHDFRDTEDLTAFCENPDNLRTWLPSEVDRIILADGLRQGLIEMGEQTNGTAKRTSQAPAQRRWPRPVGTLDTRILREESPAA